MTANLRPAPHPPVHTMVMPAAALLFSATLSLPLAAQGADTRPRPFVRDAFEHENRSVTVREDGSPSTVVSLSPTRFRDETGALRPIDRVITTEPDGAFSSLANTLRGRWGRAALDTAEVGCGDVSLAWSARGLVLVLPDGTRENVAAPESVPGRLDERGRLVYEGVYPGVTERYEVDAGRVKHEIVIEDVSWLRASEGELRFTWTFAARGTTLESDGRGGFVARDAYGAARLHVPAPFTDNVAVPAWHVHDGETLAVAVLVSDLLREDVSFPLVVDPTVVDLSLGGQDASVHGADAGDRLTEMSSVATGDLDADGVTDVVLGAPRGDGNMNARSDAGEVHVLFGPVATGDRVDLAATPADVVVHGVDVGDMAGSSVAVADVSGDGVDDLVIGAPRADGPANLRRDGGEVRILFGPFASGDRKSFATDADVTVHGAAASYLAGTAVAAGDVSGDGLADLVVSSPNTRGTGGASFVGSVHAFFGPLASGRVIDLVNAAPDVRIAGRDAGDQLGQALAVGDVTGDGTADILAAAVLGDGPTNTRVSAGEVVAAFGPFTPGTLVDLRLAPPDAIVFGGDGADNLGRSLAVGDVSGDGLGDLLLGAATADGPGNSRPDAGEIHVLFGPLARTLSVDLLVSAADVEVDGALAGDRLGVVGVGDVTGEGHGDLLAGAVGQDGAAGIQDGAGAVHAFHGPLVTGTRLDLLSSTADLVVLGHRFDDALGGALVAADVSGDGQADLLVGAALGDGPAGDRTWAGEAHVVVATNAPPTCEAGGPYRASCSTAVVDGAAASDANGDPLAFLWTTSHPDVVLADAGGVLPAGDGRREVPPASALLAPGVAPCGVTAVLELTVDDGRGGSSRCEAEVTFLDDEAPALVGVPPDATVPCSDVPPPSGVAPEDGCDPAARIAFSEERVPGDCPQRYTLVRQWTALDRCGNHSAARQVVTVEDASGPVVAENREIVACLWPPDHRMVRLGAGLLTPSITDDCGSGTSWRIVDCASSEAGDDRGDGATEPDCAVDADGQGFSVRAERSGDGEERIYEVIVVATDACGNEGAPAVAGVVRVPHDRTADGSCRPGFLRR